jgi:methylated-DNA-[protein]-cysteine S-methyltransferase
MSSAVALTRMPIAADERGSLNPSMTRIYITSFDSKIGTIHVASTDKGVCKISIPAQTKREFLSWVNDRMKSQEIVESSSKNRQIIDELNRYFDRRLVTFHTPLDLIGTEFQMRVWKELQRVRYGSIISYKELACRIGSNKGYQAVGRANATNPVPIVVPCHRIVGSDHSLVGYAAGLKTKEFLLRLEGALLL